MLVLNNTATQRFSITCKHWIKSKSKSRSTTENKKFVFQMVCVRSYFPVFDFRLTEQEE